MRRLKTSEIKAYREALLKAQNGTCGLCGEPLSPEEAVLDHCHKTGQIRRVIHRTDNILLGKIENAMIRNRLSVERLAHIAERLMEYINHGKTDVLHPTHLSPEEKTARSKARAARRKKKIAKARQG